MNTAGTNFDLLEKAKHGDRLFPLVQYVGSFHPVNPSLPLHWHPEIEFTKVLSGKAIYSIDLNEVEVEEGDMIFIQPNLLHSAKIKRKETMTSESFVFHLNLLGISSADVCSIRYFLPIMEGTVRIPNIIKKSHPSYEKLEQLFINLSNCYTSREAGYELEIKAILFQLIHLLFQQQLTPETVSTITHSERMKTIFQFIHTHYSEEISIENAAEYCNISTSHFMHYFKEKVGLTFNQYLNNYRLQQAGLLLHQNSDIADVAYSCGFNNLSYFYKRFKRYYSITPREYLLSFSKTNR